MRDTDADWNNIGRTEPYFGVLAGEQFHSSRLTPSALVEFYQSGIADVEHIRSVASRTVGLPASIDRICDFGSGVGRLTFALASYGRTVVGVDISDGMREEATKRSIERSLSNVEFVAAVPNGDFDWINSLIVFQHIPPRRGIQILQTLTSQLSSGGILTIQLTYAHDRRHVAEIVRDLNEYVYDGENVRGLTHSEDEGVGEMRMYDYDLNAVFRVLHRSGIRKIWTEHTDHAGCHGVWLFARREG
jgi:2-polyprenyl-3-methyl-5-hydroxy-6-metoxy-1,4-benzoquinol methylase